MSDFRFANAEFVHALWGVAVFVALLLWLDRRGGSALERLVRAPLQVRLVERPGAWRRTLRIALIGLAAAAAVLALMRPQWGMREIASTRSGAELMVALDVSKSMLAEDVAPNRLERAKAEIVDLLPYLKGDQLGLIAFAGRATVLSPLTPDFGFLRLVLEDTGPGSVARGGTRLAEPIRKALEGFGPSKGASRAILLITDGEDHDSFALDAAKAAAEAGVKIIAIGFGDEAGSEIRVTDPRTGARQAIRDADGKPVMSRLDGQLLRELALATGGAYVPAGTGVLDLASIYDEHIARLTRGDLEGRRTVREEGYSWFVLLALILLVSSVGVSGGRLFARGVLTSALVLFALAPTSARAAEAEGTASAAAAEEVEGGAVGDAPLDAPESALGGQTSPVEQRTPREVYNAGVAALESLDLEQAEHAFTTARRDAKGDDELRYHAAFNLGFVGVQQAGRIRGPEPEEALSQLYRAVDWFREAVRLAPADDDDARRNLEVSLKQALALADEIARAREGGVDGALKQLLDRQREEVARSASLVEQAAAETNSTGVVADSAALRAVFREGATAQRAVLSDADGLAVRVAQEREGLEARPEAERTPEDAMRAGQLGGVLEYLHRARERMGQARRQLRDRRAERGYRRSSAALHELKRAVDQLRDPVSLLDQLLREGSEIARATLLLELTARNVPGLSAALPAVPPWLSIEGLAEDQRIQALRTAELQARLATGLEQAVPAAGEAEAVPPDRAELLAAIALAEPFVRVASESAAQAADVLEAGSLPEAPEPQHTSLRALAEARERFLDLRGLIEATHASQQQIGAAIGAGAKDEAAGELLPGILLAQNGNIERAERLRGKLEVELSKLHAQQLAASAAAGAGADPQGPVDPQPPAPTPPPDPAALEQEQRRLDMAGQLVTLALSAMDGSARALSASPTAADWPAADADSEQALAHLAALRSLFFSIVEHVKELARAQVDLLEETEDALARAGGPDSNAEELVAAVLPAERALAERALAIANALEQQSTETAAASGEGAAGEAREQAEESEKGDPAAGATARDEAAKTANLLREAGEHVLLAEGEMKGATTALASPVDLESALKAETAALAELARAIEILEPEQEQEQPGEDGDSQQQQQQQQQEQEQQQQEQEQEPQAEDAEARAQEQAREAPLDPGQLLQEVRDREAQRRRDRSEGSSGYETVEKDW